MESFLTSLKKDVQCSLCNDTLIEPRILPCFHTFCKLCIKRHAELIEEVNVFKCPECKTETSLPEVSSVEDLKPSLLHSRMVKVLEFVQSEKVCSVSGSHSPPSWHCFDCDRSLCDECEKNHSLFTKDHKVVSLVEIKEEDIKIILSREANCVNHGDKTVELFCKDCEQVICIECWKHDHDEHSTINLAKYTMTNKAELLDQLEQLKAREQEMTNQIQMIEEETKELKADCENEKLLVREILQEIIDKLQRNAQKLLNQIDENVEKAEKRLAKGQSVLDHTRGAIDYMNKLIEKGIASEVIENKDIQKTCHTSVDSIAGDHYAEVAFVPNEELVKQVDSGIGTVRRVRSNTDHKKSTVEIINTPEALTKAKLAVLTKTKRNNLRNNPNDVIDVKITPEDNVDKEIKQTRTGTRIEVEFMAKVAGPLTAEVQVNGSHVSNSPLVINVKPQQMTITRTFNMKGLNTLPKNATGIAVNKENSRVAVADKSSHCVHVFNTDGNLLLTYGNQGSGQGQFNDPFGLAFVNERDLVIADRVNHRICIVNAMSTPGVLVKTFGNRGNKNGEFSYPNGVHVDDNGNIIVCDTGNRRIQVFTRDGDYQYQFGLTTQDNFGPLGTVTHDGRYYVSDANNHVIHVFEKKDGVPTRISTIGSKGSGDGKLDRPWGLAIDHDHHLLVCDHMNDRIQKFTLDGRFVGKTRDKIYKPIYITVLNDGQLLITSYATGTVIFSK